MHGPVANERIAFRYATTADIHAYYGGRPAQTLRAVVVTLNEEPMAVIGIARQETYAQFFSEYKPEFRVHLKSVPALRALKLAMAFVKETKLPVYAIAEEEEPDSVRILTRLGFVPINDEDRTVFRWHN